MATRSLNVVISGDSKPLGIASKKAVGHMDDVEKRGHRMGKAVALGFAAAGAAAAGALVIGLKKSVDAAVEAEKSQAKLKAQLSASGASYKAHAKEIDAVIQKHSRLAGVDDEDLQDAFTGIVRATGSVSKAMKDMGLVTDIMRGKNVDAATAGKILEKVHNGNVTALKKMGISIDPVTKAQDKLKDSNKNATREQIAAAKAADKQATAQKGIAELQKRFGGQAEAYGKTAAGAQDRFRVAMENVQEKLGSKLLPVLGDVANAVAKFLDGIDKGTGVGGKFADIVTGAFERAKGVISGAVGTVKGIVSAFREGQTWALALAGGLAGLAVGVAIIKTISAVTKIWAGAQVLLNLAMTANPIGLVVVGLVALGAGLVVAYKKSETFRNIVNGAFNAIKENVGPAFEIVKKVVGHAVDAVKGYVSGMATVIKGIVKVVKGVLTGDFSKAWDGIKTIVRGALDALGAVIRGVWKPLGEAMISLGKLIIRKLGEGLKALPGKALEVGEAIGKGILSGLGDLGHLLLEKAKAALSFVGDNLPGPAGALGKIIKAATGDGIGQTMGTPTLPSGGAFGGSLQGASSVMKPFAAMGSGYGLSIAPGGGKRPGGTRTSSGGVSWHGSGRAIDESGSPSGMMAYFKALKSRFGSILSELIYTPGGIGIKNGQPFRYTGAVAADHFDHVHVAYGGPGLPTGDGPGIGDGIGEIKSLWTRAGGSSSAQNMAAAIAMAESGGSPSASNRNSDGSIDRGLWQINSIHGGLSTFDRMGNAKAAVSISSNGRNWNPWTVFKTGAYKRFLSSASGTSGSGGSSGGGATSGAAGAFAKSQTAAGTAHGAEVKSQTSLAGPSQASGSFEGALDVLGLGKAEAGSDAKKLLPLLMKELNLKLARLAKVKKALKTRLTAATRSRLTQEATTLVGELSDIWEAAVAVGAKGAPPKGVVEKPGDPAADGASGADAADAPSAGDFVDAAIAEAALTPGTEDDIAAAGGAVGFWEGELGAARASGDPRRVTAAASGLKGARDSLKALTDNTESNNGLADAIKGLQAEQKRSNDIAESVQSTSNFQLTKSIADLVSGHIAGRGIAGRAFTPGSGVEWAY